MTAHSELHCTHYLPLIYSNAMHIDARARLLAAIKPDPQRNRRRCSVITNVKQHFTTTERQFIIFDRPPLSTVLIVERLSRIISNCCFQLLTLE